MDISEALIAEATAIEAAHPLGITYRVHDLLEPLPPDLGTFDIAILVMAIMDVEEPLAALRHIGRTVRPGGRVIFSLLHPCCYRPKLDAEHTGVDLATYFDRERIEGRSLEAPDGTRVSYRQFHRTLGDYLMTLVAGGFCLTEFVEQSTRQLAISCQKHQATS